MTRLKTRLFPFFLFLIFGCANHHPLITETGHSSLARRIHREILNSGLTPNMGVRVVSLKTGKTLYAFNADHLFMPASNNKIFTSTAALHYLGPQFHFVTRTFADSSAITAGSRTLGHLALKGDGDPDLTVDQLRDLANRLAGKFDRIDTLLLDDTVLDTVRQGNGWMWDEGPWWYAAQIDALTLNDNCIDFTVSPSDSGQTPNVAYFPETKYITFENHAVTVKDTVDFEPWEITRDWMNQSNAFEMTGEIMADAKESTVYRNIENPARFTGTVFQELLTEAGVKVGSVIRMDSVSARDVAVDSIVSKSLSESVHNLMKVSDNLTAELLVKTIGREVFGEPGTWKNGLTAIKTYLQDSVGVDTTRHVLADGSGVSRYNLTSPYELTEVLRHNYSDFTLNAEFMSALPTGGWDGTLKHRMNAPLFDRRIRAKTGTLSGTSCLSGYAYPLNGDPVAFSIMMNGYIGSSHPYQQLQDRICYQILKSAAE